MGSPSSPPSNSNEQQPIYSTSPQSIRHESPASFGQLFDRHGISPSLTSEIDVVLDDGSLQRRRVSLTSLTEAAGAAGAATSASSANDTTPLLLHNKPPTYMDQRRRSPAASTTSSSSSTDDDDDDDDDDSSSEDDDGHSIYSTLFSFKWLTWCRQHCIPNVKQQRVLKCSFAYFLASLFTFVPVLNAAIGYNRTSSHLVATATVFFNPAKTLGGMIEAAAYGWGYVFFALTISLGSMVTTDFFVDRNLYRTAHAISLMFWLAGATWIIAFFKAYWNKPPVATASSLCFIIIFIVVVREGSANRGDFDTTRIEEISSAVAIGTIITVLCCIIFWPVSAVGKLKKDIESTLISYRTLLKLLTKTFLLDDDLPEFEANRELHSAIESHRASFTSLQSSLHEAKLEMCFHKGERQAEKYDQIIACMHRLAQYVGGLRSSCGIQFEHISNTKTNQKAMSASLHQSNKRSRSVDGGIWNVRAGYHLRKLQDEIRRQKTMILDDRDSKRRRSDDEGLETRRSSIRRHQQQQQQKEGATLIKFIKTIRQPLKSLAFTCKRTISQLQEDFGTTPPAHQTIPRWKLKNNLTKAMELFEVAEHKAVARLYRHRNQSSGSNADEEASTYVPAEDVLLVYLFLFNMLEFARELMQLVDAVDQLSRVEEIQSSSAGCCHGWSLYWFWPKKKKKKTQIAEMIPNERNTAETLHTRTPRTPWQQFLWRIWKFTQLLKQQKFRYATKAMVAAVLLATPAFMESTGDWFREWRMEWALITLMVVMTPTVGGTNIVAIYRIFSTILGVSAAALFYSLFPANMYILPILTWLFSIPNFWVILNHKHGKFGQFTLLAYNLVMLNKYNDRETNRVDVWWLALQRFLAIVVGVVVGLFATGYVWPYEARVELRKGLSDLLIRLAWVYRKLVSTYANHSDIIVIPSDADGHGPSHEEIKELAAQSFMDLELDIQRTLTELGVLLSQAPNEFRLKGPFPVDTYRLMLRSCRNITDKFMAMRTVIFKDAWIENVHHSLVLPVSRERREMAGNILLYFYLLASALRLKTPLPPQFPPAHSAWKSLLTRMRQLPIGQSQQLLDMDHVYMFYYAYIMMMEDVIRELDKLGDNMKELFGELIPQSQWNEMFDTV